MSTAQQELAERFAALSRVTIGLTDPGPDGWRDDIMGHSIDLTTDERDTIVTALRAHDDMLAALRLVDEFAWSALTADCDEARIEINRRVNVCRAAITKAEGQS